MVKNNEKLEEIERYSYETSITNGYRTRAINHRSHYSKINYLVTKFSYCSEAANIQKQLQK